MGKLLLPLAVLFRYLHQYKSEHWGETASIFQTVLSTHDQKALDRNPQAVWTQSKHHSLCPCRQFSSSSQLIISAATYSTHPLQFQRRFPLSLFFFQSLHSTPKLPLAFSWSTASGTILCVCVFCQEQKTLFTKFMKHLPPSFPRKFCLLL